MSSEATPGSPRRILHVITGLHVGGAEVTLLRLLSQFNRETFLGEVVSLTDVGVVGERISALGLRVRALGMQPGLTVPAGLFRLARWIRQDPPHVIQTWMYHADLVGGLAAKLAGQTPVVWGIRHSNLDPRSSKRTTIWTARACARLSRSLPERIVCCSEASRRVHAALGYAVERMVVIPNGFDLDAFQPNEDARREIRNELGISDSVPLIGAIGRFDPQKDYQTFLEAASILHEWLPEVRFLLCGDGLTLENPELRRWIETSSLRDNFHFLGPREDVTRVDAALDIACSSSAYGEGFSNAVGEAMACGVPCAVTDVGDSARIVGDTGRVVPPRSPQALAVAWRELVAIGSAARRQLGAAARERIAASFGLEAMVARYEALYLELSTHVRA